VLLKNLAGKSICILGFGREGQAMLDAIQAAGINCEITIADRNSEAVESSKWKVDQIQMQLGPNYFEGLDRFDIIIKSPGVPPSELSTVHCPLTTSTQIFLEETDAVGTLVIGVTGSKGKSTTASLISEILNDALLVGNIGEPAIKHLKDLSKNKIIVQEMSSYQLMNCTSSPQIAVITSFFPEHLDYHGSEDAYLDAKKQITKNQSADDIVFYNSKSAGAKEIADMSPGKKISVSIDDAPIRLGQTKLIGQHNLINIALATAVARHLEVSDEQIAEAIKSFTPLPHRLQPCGEHAGIVWIDDSISTTPETAIAALDALGDDVKTMILGGQDRGNDFKPLAERIRQSGVRTVILLGKSGARIRSALEAASALVEVHRAVTMEEAVDLAKKQTKTGETCLLSPASPSYDMFENFEERGEAFVQCILKP